MRILLMNAVQHLFWSVYVVTIGIATPDRLRRAGLI